MHGETVTFDIFWCWIIIVGIQFKMASHQVCRKSMPCMYLGKHCTPHLLTLAAPVSRSRPTSSGTHSRGASASHSLFVAGMKSKMTSFQQMWRRWAVLAELDEKLFSAGRETSWLEFKWQLLKATACICAQLVRSCYMFLLVVIYSKMTVLLIVKYWQVEHKLF